MVLVFGRWILLIFCLVICLIICSMCCLCGVISNSVCFFWLVWLVWLMWCMQDLGLQGMLMFSMWVMCGMFRFWVVMLVVMMMFSELFFSDLMICLCWVCGMLLLSVVVWQFWCLSNLVQLRVVCLVWMKVISVLNCLIFSRCWIELVFWLVWIIRWICLMCVMVWVLVVILMCLGCFRWCLVMLWMDVGRVVEKSMVWCDLGSVLKIIFRLFMKLSLSILLVLLSIRCWMVVSSFLLWCRWLYRWLGVVMRICVFWCRVFSCGFMGVLLQMVIMLMFGNCLEQVLQVVVICRVSLWVGISISICGLWWFGLMCDSSGRVNVVVLLVLVCVWLIMLWFLRISGID